MSSPQWPTCWPGATGRVITISPAVSVAYSAGTTASTPSGTGAPVMMRTAALGRMRSDERLAGHRLAEYGKGEWIVFARSGGLRATKRIAVHGGPIKARHVKWRNHVGCQGCDRPRSPSDTVSSPRRDACSSIHFSAAGTSLRCANPCMRTSRTVELWLCIRFLGWWQSSDDAKHFACRRSKPIGHEHFMAFRSTAACTRCCVAASGIDPAIIHVSVAICSGRGSTSSLTLYLTGILPRGFPDRWRRTHALACFAALLIDPGLLRLGFVATQFPRRT